MAIVEMFDRIFADPLRAAQSLQVLRRIALPRMWELVERVARDEQHIGVLSAFPKPTSSAAG